MKKTLGQNTQPFLGRHSDHNAFPIEVTTIAFRQHGRECFLLIISDDSEIQVVKAEQQEQTQRFKAVADLAPIGILQANVCITLMTECNDVLIILHCW